MDDVLAVAKAIQRKTATETHIYIRLALLQELIGEIEDLRSDRPLKSVVDLAAQRAKGAQP